MLSSLQHSNKKQRGNSLIPSLLVIIAIGLLIYTFMVNHINQQTISSFRSSPPEITIEQIKVVDAYKNKPTPKIVPSGKYQTFEVIDGKEIKATYYFDKDNTLIKEFTLLEKYQLAGSAKYHFEGSVIVYSQINGDKYLFSEIGEALSVPTESKIVIHETTRSTEFSKLN